MTMTTLTDDAKYVREAIQRLGARAQKELPFNSWELRQIGEAADCLRRVVECLEDEGLQAYLDRVSA